MLNSFLFDFKKEILITHIHSFKQLNAMQKIQMFLASLALVMFIYFATIPCLPAMFVFIILLAVVLNKKIAHAFFSTAPPNTLDNKYDLRTCENGQTPTAERSFSQMAWFKKHRVALVRQMLFFSNTGLSQEKSIDLLISECTEKLKEKRNSEIAIKRLRPLLSLFGIIFVSLSTAYMYEKNIISKEIESSTFSLDWFSEIMQALASDIVLSETALPLFIVLCSYTVIFYLASAFLIFPFTVRIVDRDWHLTEELRSILLYIKQEDIECTENTSTSHATQTKTAPNVNNISR